ncbi:helix-turn-helix domain-containing protein [Belnapia rosea]|uniref:Transcriptional regulator, contains XRE-family HTH domain n=1 Tax=Belnapia rosea TaxID=938405 RepID=A0A1G7CS84_9PROT|nr:helix-turn-helix transcriptional regulator [Belnapia rosea]SDE42274.1 Transcriptional regulator, contains XRE-family HTH domain [Belnapia rosea]
MGRAALQQEPHSEGVLIADEHVSARIRERRVMMGLSQQQLARRIGVTYQQAHKYERGLSRISAGRLFAVAQALATDPAWFFEGMPEQDGAKEQAPRQRLHLELMRNFASIKDEKQQEAISGMARTLAGS